MTADDGTSECSVNGTTSTANSFLGMCVRVCVRWGGGGGGVLEASIIFWLFVLVGGELVHHN